ncbi:PEX22 [[Candida] subhashii]|uniref:PEX22 n=1 Tax=[Candida] subhashii TaxID=561895 RepID=A0A8J5UEU4_9ASCO|nr:PEX22 [[Candida] subhashii]KAG7661473.1 PEX22 [[Candida] subhashii]
MCSNKVPVVGEQQQEEGSQEEQSSIRDEEIKYLISKQYSNKSIAITLSSTFLSSNIPLNEILINSENMIFIIPPNLSEKDLDINIPPNFKLLKCSNVQGYLQMLKNLKPDLLFLCSDDLGINFMNLNKDLRMFIKTIINVDQNKNDIYDKIKVIFD